MNNNGIILSTAECTALFETLEQLTGGNPENVFAWDGSDDPDDPTTSAWAKVFVAAGRSVPTVLRAS